jgi:hypothetical protein
MSVIKPPIIVVIKNIAKSMLWSILFLLMPQAIPPEPVRAKSDQQVH